MLFSALQLFEHPNTNIKKKFVYWLKMSLVFCPFAKGNQKFGNEKNNIVQQNLARNKNVCSNNVFLTSYSMLIKANDP